MLDNRFIQFLKENKQLIIENTPESWETLYNNFHDIFGEYSSLSKILLKSKIDPTMILGYIPEVFLEFSDIEEYQIMPEVKRIKNGAFYCCDKLKQIRIPKNVNQIDEYAFYACENLIKVIIDEGVTNIGNSAFNSCSSLVIVSLPSTLNSIGYDVFSWCSKLKKIKFKGTKEQAYNIKLNRVLGEGEISKIICSDGDLLYEEE